MPIRHAPIERILFGIFLIALLTPVWTFPYFLMGDGPCHLYNSRVLLDFWLDRNTDFYGEYYFTNRVFNPNWFSHFTLTVLQMLVPALIAEKLLISGYIIMFTFGFRYLLSGINRNSTFLSLTGVLLTMHYLIQGGFFNYSFSIAMFFWVAGYWLRHRRDFSIKNLLIQAFLWLLLYFMHPIGLVFGFFFVAFTLAADAVRAFRQSGRAGILKLFREHIPALLLMLLPVLLRFSEYIYFNEWKGGANQESRKDVFNNLLDFTALMTLSTKERATATLTGVLIALSVVGAIVFRLRKRKWKHGDFLILFFAMSLLYFYHQTGKHSIELLMPLRLQLFPWLALLLWSATADFPNWFKTGAGLMSALLLGLFLYFRWPVYRAHSGQVAEYMECLPHIRDRTGILVLNYNLAGPKKTDGEPLANKAWNFMHAADYIGTERTVIMSDNYEALRTYFPLGWRWQRDMYGQTAKDGITFENIPPRADFIHYTQRTGGSIDYVLLLGLHEESPDWNHPYTREIFDQLHEGYKPVFETRDQELRLYELKR